MGLVTGILFAYYVPVANTSTLLIGLILSVITLGGLKVWANRHPHKGWYFGLAIYPAFIILGLFLVKLHNPLENPQHYTKKLAVEEQEHTLLFNVQKRLKPSENYEKYVISLTQSDRSIIKGKVLLYLQKDSENYNLEGKQFLTYGQLEVIKKPLNPHQFDYSEYVKRQGIYHQIRLKTTDLIPTPQTTAKTLQDHANNLRTFLATQLEKQTLSPKTLAITKALVLGQRQDIDPETYKNYVNAGAIHILAVSGLHIGIFLWILNFLFSPLLYLKNGKTLRLLLTLLFLWIYAYLTGLSPSVLRAVTLFSFIAIGQHIRHKKGSTYNALLISAFILLCCNPMLLFDIGFQLSYAAVFAIFWIQPLIARYYRPRFFLDRLYWDVLTVTIAAQLGVLPLSIYYFHQFPLLFFVTNLAIVPILGALLGFGILVVTLAAIDILPTFLVTTYNFLIERMNMLVEWVASKDTFLWSSISFSKVALITGYLVLISGVLALKKFQPQRIYRFGIFLVVFISVLIVEKIRTQHEERFIVFQQYKNTLLGHHTGNRLTLLSRDSVPEKTTNYMLKPYAIAQQIKTQSQAALKNAYRYKEQALLIIDSTGFYSSTIQPKILLLTQSPKIHLDRIIDSLHPQKIIADGSNYPSVVRRWKATCKKRDIPFYNTAVSGAFVLE